MSNTVLQFYESAFIIDSILKLLNSHVHLFVSPRLIVINPSLPAKPRKAAAPGLHNGQANVYEVASRAGVSPATVSRVMNRPELVAASTRARVQATMATLNYLPNASAQALSRGRSQVIGALIPHIGYSIYADYMDAVQRVCTAAGYSLVLGVHHFDEKDELRQARDLVSLGIDGLLLVGFQHDSALFDLLAQRRLSYVCTSVYDPKSSHPCVGYDNYKAGYQIAEYLLKLGHTALGVITGDTQKNDRMAVRLAGFKAALRKHHITLPKQAIFEGDYTLADGHRGFTKLYETCTPTALMCGNDIIALGVLLEAQSRGLTVPGNLSLIGFDNLEWAGHFPPALSTVRVPLLDMGHEAANALIARIEGRVMPHAVQLPIEIMARQTTAPHYTITKNLPRKSVLKEKIRV